MDHRAIIFDLDGTAVASSASAPDAPPSVRLVEAVRNARGITRPCAATGRSVGLAAPILSALDITDPCVTSAGS